VNLLELGVDRIVVRFGPGFRAEVRRDLIAGVRVVRPPKWRGIGAHGWRGDWLVNARWGDAVELTLSEPVRGHVLGVPVKVRKLTVVVDDPAAVVAQLPFSVPQTPESGV
jgi:hypothetical protein